ncbi:hypothetical protein [Actinoplanes utahensis]|uniref:hypothetical protein n=1 Tax=Actinoplanes utahensis TaxID=1869 RepID=UPI0007C7F684|nr:hypothetical protein [Actinoplanes utahensis]GIF31652.1 hypothetical protein Aut01nite_46380 [Actinoplanes utahensis]
MFDQKMPALLATALTGPFATDHESHDFEPFDQFDSAEELRDWWTAWTGNENAGVPPLRCFGQDGTGGLAAIWVRDPAAAIDTQPVVFLGSEGELAVLARDLGDYVWLLAGGVGPLEAVSELERTPTAVPEIVALAPGAPRTIEAILADARPLLEELEEFVKETVHGPFDEFGEPLR